LPQQIASLSDNVAEDDTSTNRSSRRSLPMAEDIVKDEQCTGDETDDKELFTDAESEKFRHLDNVNGLLPQQNASTSDTALSPEHQLQRTFLPIAIDVVPDDHCTDDEKQLLSNSSKMADDVIPDAEPHSNWKSDDNTGYDFKSPITVQDMPNHDAGQQPHSISYVPHPLSQDPSKQQQCLFTTAHCSISVFVYTGDMLQERVDAIVNPANADLAHSRRVAMAIATAAGWQLQDECDQYVKQKGPLNVTEVMHTTAGNLRPNVLHVIHAACPNAAAYSDQSKLHADLRATFYNCLRCVNDVLKVKSMAIPAIGSGLYNNQHNSFYAHMP